MKINLSIVILFLLFVSVSCKKDNEEPHQPIDKALISTLWNTTLERQEFYNDNDGKVYEVSRPIGVQYRFTEEDHGVRRTHLDGTWISGVYELSTENAQDFITITWRDGTVDVYQIIAYTNKTMSWIGTAQDKEYTDNGVTRTAATRVTHIDFHCPCRD